MHIPTRLNRSLGGACLTLALFLALLLTAGCDEPPPAPKPQAAPPAPMVDTTPPDAEQLTALTRFQARSAELLEGLLVCSQSLATLGDQFLQQPDDANLDSLKEQWQGCLELYEAGLVLQGFTPEQQQALQQLRGNLGNSLQMPGFIDSIQGYPFSGIVNDASLPLDAANLREQHGLTDAADVSIGFDVVAFLLWGEQRQNPELAPRPVEDYMEAEAWEDSATDLPIAEHPNNRRRRLLSLTLGLLAEDSLALLQQWQQAAPPTTRQQFLDWQQQQLQAMADALDQQPGNSQLQSHLQSWLADQAIPGLDNQAAEPDTEPSTEQLRQQLSRALGQATTEPG